MSDSGEPSVPSSVADLTGSEPLDLLIVGGGPAGTAAAFRAKELGLRALLIDFDEILKRIRDYPKDKLILPDFGGGDRMRFPAGGELLEALQFEPIDKDELCARWKALFRKFDVPMRVGVEFTSVEPDGDTWKVNTWDHKRGEAGVIRTRHVVLALGRGVPRRFDIPGNTDGISYRMDDPDRYVNGPVIIVGGGTSAAEAVIAISNRKSAAEEESNVYWSYRGTKMPRISRALASEFFEAYVGNGNIQYCARSEPVAVVTSPERTEFVSFRIDRKTPADRPPETVHLEFMKTNCIACIGEDIPEALLREAGIEMVSEGPNGKKQMALTPLLETRQPRIYLIGDLLSQTYLETDGFGASQGEYRQVKHRGNIKTALRDGAFVAEVVKQRLEGREHVDVVIRDAEPAAGRPPDPRVSAVLGLTGEGGEASTESPADLPGRSEAAYLVAATPGGVEVGEFNLKPEGVTTIGRVDCDVSFPHDTLLSDSHASVSRKGDGYVVRDDGSRGGTYVRVKPDRPIPFRHGDFLRAGRQILVLSHAVRGGEPKLEHYNAVGERVGTHRLRGTTVFGRSGGKSDPDVRLDDHDLTLSRFHFSVVEEEGVLSVHDFGSRNGTYLKVDGEWTVAHGDVIRVGGQELEIRLREDLPQKTGSRPVPVSEPEAAGPIAAPPPPEPAGASAEGPHVSFAGQDISGPIDASQTLLEWADEKEVSLDYECWIGMCGCDVVRVVSGAEHLNDVEEKEAKTLKRKGLEAGPYRLACMTRVSGPVVMETVD